MTAVVTTKTAGTVQRTTSRISAGTVGYVVPDTIIPIGVKPSCVALAMTFQNFCESLALRALCALCRIWPKREGLSRSNDTPV